ncbi:hypothetical protein ACVW0Q_002094 [Thermostichus sp. MS-CIW-21]|jgi:hypothetical protein|uniref:hypothetical protein n=1 Tax=unclassified Synechococcus TaxID=2626047 RepID=UPI000C4ECC99|nr:MULTISPECIES: hypothetical protein [unclassified Synechococcus]PIK85420.1 hypothetical protein SYN63AY4M2_02525 [Synechococcus sp. 63AY4M2]PIK88676.1 hypothetical protein SYN65AY6A5_06270 [Synechococcus sp. 65AY6A5]
MKISPSLAARLLGAVLWQAWSVLVGFFNDRLLPERCHVRPEALPEWMAQVWAGYLRYRKASRPGAIQFRGLTVDPGQEGSSAHLVGAGPLRYRGCPLETVARDAVQPFGKTPFVPPYQRLLNTLRLKLSLADVDSYSVTPALQRVYRGQEL